MFLAVCFSLITGSWHVRYVNVRDNRIILNLAKMDACFVRSREVRE